MTRRSDRPAGVPSFALYGESESVRDLEFVHLEHIATRSQRYNWEIQSHTHRGLFQVLCLFEGGARVRLDTAALDIGPPAAIVVPPGTVHAFQFRPATYGYVLTVADALLAAADPAQRALLSPLRLAPRRVDLSATPGTALRIAGLLEQIMDELRRPQRGRHQMLDWLVRGVLLLVARELGADPLSESERGRVALLARLRELVEVHFAEHWPVSRYAAALKVTESRLNRLCRAQAGQSAFDIVQDRLLLEARRRLYYIAAPVSQLAYELGFVDPAYFCRFFRKHTGMAPSEFRRRRDDAT